MTFCKIQHFKLIGLKDILTNIDIFFFPLAPELAKLMLVFPMSANKAECF